PFRARRGRGRRCLRVGVRAARRRGAAAVRDFELRAAGIREPAQRALLAADAVPGGGAGCALVLAGGRGAAVREPGRAGRVSRAAAFGDAGTAGGAMAHGARGAGGDALPGAAAAGGDRVGGRGGRGGGGADRTRAAGVARGTGGA